MQVRSHFDANSSNPQTENSIISVLCSVMGIINLRCMPWGPSEIAYTFMPHAKSIRSYFADLGPVSLTVFSRNYNSMETSPCHNSIAGHQIATNFCTCHDSTAVVPCTKFCSNHCIRIEVRVKRNFHRVWIAIENPLVKRGPAWYSGHMGSCAAKLILICVDSVWWKRCMFPIGTSSECISLSFVIQY